MKKPLIGITSSIEYQDLKRKETTVFAFDYVKRAYFEAIQKAGGIPIIFPNLTDIKAVDKMLSTVDGLLITGGEDVHPKFYNEKREAKNLEITQERDIFEINVVRKAFKKKYPILGVCRGLQLLNVAFGGTLYQDLAFRKKLTLDHTSGGPLKKKKHPVKIKKNTVLYSILKAEQLQVNTSHHQIVKKVAPELQVSAWSKKDGVVEALESVNKPVLAVQWHPEVMLSQANSLALFKWLVKQAALSIK